MTCVRMYACMLHMLCVHVYVYVHVYVRVYVHARVSMCVLCIVYFALVYVANENKRANKRAKEQKNKGTKRTEAESSRADAGLHRLDGFHFGYFSGRLTGQRREKSRS